MIDLHTHILPGSGDGARDREQSQTLLNMLREQGVDTVVATPHYYGRNKGVRQFLEVRQRALEQLSLPQGMRLVAGCECNVASCANGDFDDLRPLSIGGTRYILTEMSFAPKWDRRMWERLQKLIDTGLVPVIAHVEIYPAIRKNPQDALHLMEAGCLLQINCDSVLSHELYPLVRALIEHEQAHCLGSDTHNTETRPPQYAQAIDVLRQDFGDALGNRLQQNMEAILRDEDVQRTYRAPVKRGHFGKYL